MLNYFFISLFREEFRSLQLLYYLSKIAFPPLPWQHDKSEIIIKTGLLGNLIIINIIRWILFNLEFQSRTIGIDKQ